MTGRVGSGGLGCQQVTAVFPCCVKVYGPTLTCTRLKPNTTKASSQTQHYQSQFSDPSLLKPVQQFITIKAISQTHHY
ncbi:hypothetical protein Pmani_021689 [Petrolisthes manimaculis]|uniref:Uncharacterized protein n=1 Tax=Petrolisthes manimaculis TaxID=1843537 RepID=A0AAE1PFJ4_9EUCA|nr:hypothetical protein Pmani_021689 [Petrolisthes manimaculis]